MVRFPQRIPFSFVVNVVLIILLCFTAPLDRLVKRSSERSQSGVMIPSTVKRWSDLLGSTAEWWAQIGPGNGSDQLERCELCDVAPELCDRFG